MACSGVLPRDAHHEPPICGRQPPFHTPLKPTEVHLGSPGLCPSRCELFSLYPACSRSQNCCEEPGQDTGGGGTVTQRHGSHCSVRPVLLTTTVPIIATPDPMRFGTALPPGRLPTCSWDRLQSCPLAFREASMAFKGPERASSALRNCSEYQTNYRTAKMQAR